MKKLKTRESGLGPGTTSQYLIETGTWTPFVVAMDPQVSYLPADVTHSPTGQNGTYQRIGTWVYYSCNIILTNNGTSTLDLFISGLPYEQYYNDDDYMEYNASISWSNLPVPPGPISSVHASSYAYNVQGHTGIQLGWNDGTYLGAFIPINTLPDDFYIGLTGAYRTYPNATRLIY